MPRVSNAEKAEALEALKNGSLTEDEVAAKYDVSYVTVRRWQEPEPKGFNPDIPNASMPSKEEHKRRGRTASLSTKTCETLVRIPFFLVSLHPNFGPGWMLVPEEANIAGEALASSLPGMPRKTVDKIESVTAPLEFASVLSGLVLKRLNLAAQYAAQETVAAQTTPPNAEQPIMAGSQLIPPMNPEADFAKVSYMDAARAARDSEVD